MFFLQGVFLSVLTSVNSLSCISVNNQECKERSQLLMLMGMILCFYLLVLKQVNAAVVALISKIYAHLCFPDIVKNLNVKVFSLVSGINETKGIEWHETCKCKYRLNSSVCNDKQRWNDDKCRRERKELIDKGACNKGFIWNPSNCECDCYKFYDFS